jgi:Spy/CpxP family protein refolding chaperone
MRTDRRRATGAGGRAPLRIARLAMGVLAMAVLAVGADAQGPPVRPTGQGGRGIRQDSTRRPPTPAERQEMERRMHERINSILRERLALTDDQFTRMRDVAMRIETERRRLRREEFEIRVAMRDELLGGRTPNEARVAELLDRMLGAERRRIDLMEREQRELSGILSASQRARYVALQDELRRNMQDMQQRRMGDGRQWPPGPPAGADTRRRPPSP